MEKQEQNLKKGAFGLDLTGRLLRIPGYFLLAACTSESRKELTASDKCLTRVRSSGTLMSVQTKSKMTEWARELEPRKILAVEIQYKKHRL